MKSATVEMKRNYRERMARRVSVGSVEIVIHVMTTMKRRRNTMNEIKITIEGLKELTEAVRALAGMDRGQTDTLSTQHPVTGMAPAGQMPTSIPMQQPQVPVAAPQSYVQAPVQPAAPVTTGMPQAQSAAVPTAVPTTAMPQEYTIEQLQVAAAGLSQMGRMPQVMGIQAMTELPRERYGEFATALREAGAQI